MALPVVQNTLDALATSILRTARGGGAVSDDERWMVKQIQYFIQHYRSQLIWDYAMYEEGDEDKRRPRIVPVIDPQTTQDIGCAPLLTVDKSRCPKLPWGCCVKLLADVPNVVDLPNMKGVTYFGTIDKQTPFSYIDRNDIFGVSDLRFANILNKYYVIGNDYYIITANTQLAYANMSAVFEDPTLVCAYTQAASTCCFDIINDIYPCSARMQQEIQDLIIEKELKVMLETPHQPQNISEGI